MENTRIPRPFCGTKTTTVKSSGRWLSVVAAWFIFVFGTSAQSQRKPHSSRRAPSDAAASKAPTASTVAQLQDLSRALKKKNPAAAYEKLSAFANQNSKNAYGARAALALGYYDYSKTNFGLASKWLARAQSEPLLRDYALYWNAETNIALSKQGDAIAQLHTLRSDFPDSVMTDQALESLAGAAIALNQPNVALEALDAYPATKTKPALLFLRGEAREQAGRPLEAVEDYQLLYLRYPVTEQARQANAKLDFLRSTLKSGLSGNAA